jgi:hypothetical protein
VHGQFDFLASSTSERFHEARTLLIAQRTRTSHLGANPAGRLIRQAIEFAVDGFERDQSPLIDQIGEEILDRAASAALSTDAFQDLAPFVSGVKRLEESPLELRICCEKSRHVVELAPDRCDFARLPSQREKSARVAVGGFVLHG